MTVLAVLLMLQGAAVPPYLVFPDSTLDDPAAYEGYSARLYHDSSGNSVETYIVGKTGLIVHRWTDALNESIGFTVRNSGGQKAAAAVAFARGPAAAWSSGGRRLLGYAATGRGTVHH